MSAFVSIQRRLVSVKSGTKKSAQQHTVTCSSGITVTTKPVSVRLLELFQLSHLEPEPPMVEAVIVGGDTELIPNPEDPAYLELKAEFNKRATDDFLNLIFEFGVDLDLPEDDSWERKLKRIGMTIPEDPDDKRLFYIQTIVMPDFVSDLANISASVLRQSGVDEEAINSWMALF